MKKIIFIFIILINCSKSFSSEFPFNFEPLTFDIDVTSEGSPPYVFCESPCIAFCGGYPTKLSMNDKFNIPVPGDISNIKFDISFRPNPSNNKTDIKISGEFVGKLNIDIYGSNSSKVKSLSLAKRNRIEIFSLETSDLTNGIYFYKLLIDGISYGSGSFIIIH